MKSHINNVPISEFAIVIGGYAFKSEDFIEEGIPVIKIKNIGDKKLSFEETDYLPHSFLDIPDKFKIKFGDVLISMTGSHITQPNSAVGRVARSYSREISLVNQRVGKMQVNPKKCDLGFLYHYMSSDVFRDQIGLRSRGAANQANVSGKDIEGIPIPNFSLEAQQKIATILSAYDDLIENNLKCIKLLEEMAQITYEEWFVCLKFPGHETTPIDSETGLPDGWNEAEITAISFINANSIKTKDAPESIKYIDIASTGTGFYQEPDAMSFVEAPSRARRKVNFGDTIFSTVRPNRKTYSLILEDDPMLVASTGFAVLTPKIKNTFPFVYLTVVNQTFVDRAVAVGGGAAYPAINQNDFEKIKIIKPDDALVKLFSEKVINNFIVKRKLIKQNQLLKEARSILLPRLMTGMIDVEQLVLPEPFSNTPSSLEEEPQAA